MPDAVPRPVGRSFDDLLSDASREPQHWRKEAIAAFDAGDLRLALVYWRRVLSLQQRQKDALFQIGCCHALLDEPAQAFLAFQSVATDARTDQQLRRRAAELAKLVDPIAG